MRILIIILLISWHSLDAQTPYNFRLDNDEIQALGQLVYELEDTYLCIGRGIDTSDWIRGAYATEIDKNTGEILFTDKYVIPTKEIYFNRGNTVIELDNTPYFLSHASDTILLSYYDQINHKIEIENKIASSVLTSSLFIYNFHYKDGVFYILAGHASEVYDKVIFMYDIESKELEELFYSDEEGTIFNPRMQILPSDNFLISYSMRLGNVFTLYVAELDHEGNILWKSVNPVDRESYVNAFMPIDSSTYILGVNNSKEDPNSNEPKIIPYLLKYNLETKEFVNRCDFDIPNNEWFRLNTPVEEIVRSHDGNSFLCVAELFDFPLGDENLFSSGMVAKVDNDLSLIWKRKYKYISIEYSKHNLQDIIATSDGNYLCYGTSIDADFAPSDIPFLSWVFKIDEDGKLIGDTTSTSIDWVEEDYDSEIEIFPNPATDALYINQDDINNVEYSVYTMNGQLEDKFTLSSSYQSVIKSIDKWSIGHKVIVMGREGKVIGNTRIVKQ